jgi:hypothetical protein
MFPSLLVQPEVTAISPYVAYLILSFGFLLARFKKIVACVFLAAILIAPSASAFMYIPGGCGTMCMAQQQQWGPPMFFPGAYMYPPLMPPWMFYGNPTSMYQMMPPWYYGTPPFVAPRGSF